MSASRVTGPFCAASQNGPCDVDMDMKMLVASARALAHAVVARYRPRLGDPTEIVPVVLVLALSLPVSLLVGVPTLGVGIGLVLGAILGGAIAVETYRVAAHETRRKLAEADAEADRRVVLVTRQYEWAVNDVANLRDALRRSQTALAATEAREHARRVRIDELERVIAGKPERSAANGSVVYMRSRVYEERGLTWLRAETAASASQIRVRGGDRGILTISKRVLEPSTDGTKAFVVRIPGDVAAAIEAHEDRAYAVEALIGEVWVPAALEAIAQATPTEPAAAETVVVDGTAADLARDLAGFLDALGIARAIVAGSSLGGVVTAQFALDHPGRALALVIGHTVPYLDDAGRAWLAAQVADARAGRPVITRQPADAGATEGPPTTDPAFAASALGRMVLTTGTGLGRTREDIARAIAVLRDHDLRPRRSEHATIDVPTLVIVGEREPRSTIDGAREWASWIPGAEFLVLPGAHHAAPREAGPAWNTAVQAFLDRRGLGGESRV